MAFSNNGKKTKSDKSPYNIFYPLNCNTLPPIKNIPEEGIQTVSIDIAIKNFAVRIERRFPNDVIIPIYFKREDFRKYGENTNETNGTDSIDPNILSISLKFMLDIMDHIRESRIIGVERQVGMNYKSTRMFQHVISILLCYAPTFKYPDAIVFDINPKLKSKILNCPKGLTENYLKKWSIGEAIKILEKRGDKWSLEYLYAEHGGTKSKTENGTTKSKADDLADTITQMEAWFIYNNTVNT